MSVDPSEPPRTLCNTSFDHIQKHKRALGTVSLSISGTGDPDIGTLPVLASLVKVVPSGFGLVSLEVLWRYIQLLSCFYKEHERYVFSHSVTHSGLSF